MSLLIIEVIILTQQMNNSPNSVSQTLLMTDDDITNFEKTAKLHSLGGCSDAFELLKNRKRAYNIDVTEKEVRKDAVVSVHHEMTYEDKMAAMLEFGCQDEEELLKQSNK